MRMRFRHCLSLAMAAVIVLASGITGYAAYTAHAAHDGDVAVGHAHGYQAGSDDHHHGGLMSKTYVLLCDIHGSCDEEPGETRTHVHVSCCGAPAVAPSNGGLNFTAHSEVVPISPNSSAPLDNLSYPLLRPPRAAL